MTNSRYFLAWNWVEEQLNNIGEQIESKELEFVSGIPRGGLIPAVMASHLFGIKYISYSSAKLLPKDLRENTLVIDDIADTGHTLIEANELGFLTGTLAVRSTTQTLPTFSGELIYDERWLVFPWETLNSESKQDYLLDSE